MGLSEYVTSVAQLAGASLVERGWRHPAQLLAEHGRSMTFDASSFAGARDARHECYANAGRRAILGDGTYCEGYVLVCGVPIEHAWLLMNGRVVDPTLEHTSAISEYFGVEIRTEYLARVCLNTQMWGVLDAMLNPDILTAKLGDVLASNHIEEVA